MKTKSAAPRLIACLVLLISAVLFAPSVMAQDAATVFTGTPLLKITEGGIERTLDKLPRERAINFRCVISKIGDAYYWASRDNVRLARVESGVFITFVAVNGAGYVRIIAPEGKKIPKMSRTEEAFDYVEHLTTGLSSITYYGAQEG